LRRRYVTYCIPLIALDAVEKKIVDSHAAKKDVLASSSRQP
jgi:hypothetical protein